jgi:hypothetical protein
MPVLALTILIRLSDLAVLFTNEERARSLERDQLEQYFLPAVQIGDLHWHRSTFMIDLTATRLICL